MMAPAADAGATRPEGPAGKGRWTVGITDYITPPADLEARAFPQADFCFLQDWRSSEAVRNLWGRVDALLVWHYHLDAATAAVLDRCRLVVRYGVGYDLVDVRALASRGIAFANTPDYGTEEVADTACAMILGLHRQIAAYDRAARTYTQGWQEHILVPQQRTSGRTLGLVGVGRIGTAVAIRMKAFGFRILGYDPYQPSGHEKAVGYRRCHRLEDLLHEADVVSLHCPLTPETQGMVDEAFLARMRPGATLVNTARGGLLESLDVLEAALRSGDLSSAGLDVLPDEPPRDHALIRAWRADEPWIRGRLLINPHTAWYSEQAWQEMRYKAAETARLFLVENRLRNRIEP